MDILSTLEQLAKMTHHHAKLNTIIDELPSEIKNAFTEKDCHLLRKTISNLTNFSDAKTVTQI